MLILISSFVFIVILIFIFEFLEYKEDQRLKNIFGNKEVEESYINIIDEKIISINEKTNEIFKFLKSEMFMSTLNYLNDNIKKSFNEIQNLKNDTKNYKEEIKKYINIKFNENDINATPIEDIVAKNGDNEELPIDSFITEKPLLPEEELKIKIQTLKNKLNN